MSDVKKIVALKKALEDRDRTRNDAYDTILKHYGGGTYTERKKKGSWVKEALSSLMNSGRESDPAPAMRVNLIRPAVLAKVAYMGLPPQIRVPEPPVELVGSEEAAMELADKLERVLLGHWKFSNMARRFHDAAWFQGAFGSAVIGVWPDVRHKRPRIFVRSPQNFYADAYDEDGLELKHCLWVEEMDGYAISAKWGEFNAKLDNLQGKEDIEVIHYIDEEQYAIVIDNKDFAFPPLENKLGKVPVVVVGNIGIPGSIFGDTDVEEGIETAKEINYQLALVNEQARKNVEPTVVIKEGREVPEDFALGEGGVIEVGQNGDVNVIGTIPLPHQHFQLIQQLQAWFDLITDNPAALRGEGFGSILTGKGFNALLSPIASRLSQRRTIFDTAVSQVNRYLLEMWWKFPMLNRKTTLTGDIGKDFFYLEAEPDDFVIDGEMWTENEVFLSAQSFVDRQGTDVEIMQLRQQNPPLISWQTAVEMMPYVDNKSRERKRIEDDMRWQAMLMQQMQMPQAAPQDAEAQAYAMERGATQPSPEGQMAPATPIGEGASPADMQLGAMPEEAAPAPDESQEAVAELFDLLGSIAKLKGRVWVAGGVLTGDLSLGIDIYVEVAADKQTIINAVKKDVPELTQPTEAFPDGQLHFHVGEPNPDEQAVLVAGGEQGVAPDSSMPPEPMPEEAMMGAPAGVM